MCVYQEVRKNVELVLWSISTILVRIKCVCTCKLQNTNYVILQMSKIFLYLLFKLALHDIKVSSNICAFFI